jgi:hypothetical protein
MADPEKATPRPWAWEWDCENNITIFQPSLGLHSVEIASVYCENHKSDKAKANCEADAELIVAAVNTHDPMRHPNG